MREYPRTLPEFEAAFATEAACRDYLFRVRWPDGFRCPRCGHPKAWPIGNTLFQCTQCHYRASLTSGTIFENTRKPLRLWFRAMWWVSSQKTGASALGFRFNRRSLRHRGLLFYRFVQQAVVIQATSYKDMVAYCRGPRPRGYKM